MKEVSNLELIKMAKSVLKPRKIDGLISGDVACGLVSGSGKVYLGVCVDV